MSVFLNAGENVYFSLSISISSCCYRPRHNDYLYRIKQQNKTHNSWVFLELKEHLEKWSCSFRTGEIKVLLDSHWTTIWKSRHLRHICNSSWRRNTSPGKISQWIWAHNHWELQIRRVFRPAMRGKPDWKGSTASESVGVEFVMTTKMMQLSCMHIFVQCSFLLNLLRKTLML